MHPPFDIEEGLPPWAAAIAIRLDFFARQCRSRRADGDLTTVLTALRGCAADPSRCDRVLQDFLHACLALFAEAAGKRSDLAEVREELEALCRLARTAVDGDHDDRPVIGRASALQKVSGVVGWAAHVPGRVVWLAAMVAQVPQEQGAAAVMLVNDLAAVDPDLPLRALAVAVRSAT